MYRAAFNLHSAFLVALSLIGAYNLKYFIVKLYTQWVGFVIGVNGVSKPLNSEKGV